MKQHIHHPQLLLPGTVCDIWRQPDRKDEDGWRGPAEIISIERNAGSAIVKHQGQPLIVPLHHIRKHVLQGYFHHLALQQPEALQYSFDFCNFECVTGFSEIMHMEDYVLEPSTTPLSIPALGRLMDIVDGSTPTTLHWFGIVWKDLQYTYIPDEDTVNQCEPLKLACEIFQDNLRNPHGIIFGNQLRRLPSIASATWALLFRWHRRNRAEYTIKFQRPDNRKPFTGDQHRAYSTVYLYSYDHQEELEDLPLEDLDWSDITSIDWPDDFSEPDISIPPSPQHPRPRPKPPDEAPPSLPYSKPPDPPQDPPAPPTVPSRPRPPSSSTPTTQTPHINPPYDQTMSPDDTVISDDELQVPTAPTAPPAPPAPPGAPMIPLPQQPVRPQITRRTSTTQATTDSLRTPATPRLQSDVDISDRAADSTQSPTRHDRTRSPVPSASSHTPPHTPEVQPQADDSTNDLNRSRTPLKPRTVRFDDFEDRQPATPPAQSTKRQEPSTPIPTSPTPAPALKKPKDQEPDSPQPDPTSSSSTGGPLLPIANDASSNGRVPSGEPAGDVAPDTSDAAAPNQDDTIEYEDPDKTLEYSDDEHKEMIATFATYAEDYEEAKATYHIDKVFEEHFASTPVEAAYQQMYNDLYDELRDMPAIMHSKTMDYDNEYYLDVNDYTVFRVEQDTALITDDSPDFAYYGRTLMRKLIKEADHRELRSFVEHKVFEPLHRSKLPKGTNLVDCVWVRKWAERGVKIKSRLCARGCFDRQKYFIERHSSTATRLSQRMVVSSSMTNTIYNPTSDPKDVTVESFDISTGFLQGLEFKELQRYARTLGYEYREDRDVFIEPPPNVWDHFRKMPDAPSSWKQPDHQRGNYALRCLRAMYGFADAPLMFQLALVDFLNKMELYPHTSTTTTFTGTLPSTTVAKWYY